MMEAVAKLKYARVSAQKARLVADLVRGREVSEAIEILTFTQKKSAPMIRKLVESAVANAENTANRDSATLDVDDLYIKTIFVDKGSVLHRFRPRAQGRATKIQKQTSHITVVLDTREE
jgi:large subunit ribosomal protein L22